MSAPYETPAFTIPNIRGALHRSGLHVFILFSKHNLSGLELNSNKFHILFINIFPITMAYRGQLYLTCIPGLLICVHVVNHGGTTPSQVNEHTDLSTMEFIG